MELFMVALAAYQCTAFTRSVVDRHIVYARWLKPAVTAIYAMAWDVVWLVAISPYRFTFWVNLGHIAIYAAAATGLASFIHRAYALLFYGADALKQSVLSRASKRGY